MASHCLNAIPMPSLGLKLDTISLRIACVLRMGSPLCAGRFSTHSHVINLIKKALESAHVPTVLEPQVISRTDGKWRDGITIFSFFTLSLWKRGRTGKTGKVCAAWTWLWDCVYLYRNNGPMGSKWFKICSWGWKEDFSGFWQTQVYCFLDASNWSGNTKRKCC